jgi:hypothetical protein
MANSALSDLFDTRDICGNETVKGYSDFDSDTSDDGIEASIGCIEQDSSGVNSENEGAEEGQTETSERDELDTSSLENKIGRALPFFDNIGLKVDDFLDGISWGDEACTQNAKIRNKQTCLLESAKLPGILQRWATPPCLVKGVCRRREHNDDRLRTATH